MEVLEGQNILVTISGKKSKIRVYYLSWLKSKILKNDTVSSVAVTKHPSLLRLNFQGVFSCFLGGVTVHTRNTNQHSLTYNHKKNGAFVIGAGSCDIS